MIKFRNDPSHDFEHVMRVYGNAKNICKIEGGDIDVVLAAALLHDVEAYPKRITKSSMSSKNSTDVAREFLIDCGWEEDKIDKVSYCIRTHAQGLTPSTIEGKILQDADRLDALGAVGIARAFSVSGSEKRFFYNPEDPFHILERELSQKDWTLDHFYTELLRVKNSMHTLTARKLAQERTLFMWRFLKQMQKEVFLLDSSLRLISSGDIANAGIEQHR
jgi:uncharacterized protein